MRLSEKYISKSENEAHADQTKKILSDDAFAICEFIEKLAEIINMRRLN